MASLIVDASVAVRWYLLEDGVATAETILHRDEDLIAPEIVLAEIGNAVWKRVRKNEVSVEDATEIIARATSVFATLVPIRMLAIDAMRISGQFDHPIYDCLYIALAIREGATLATADRKMAALAEQAGVAVEMVG
jgi:predicted nucleic acid-binding protein